MMSSRMQSSDASTAGRGTLSRKALSIVAGSALAVVAVTGGTHVLVSDSKYVRDSRYVRHEAVPLPVLPPIPSTVVDVEADPMPQVEAHPAVPQPVPAAYVRPEGRLGIPGSVLKAYYRAAAITQTRQPRCHLDWALVASIGRIESGHARGGSVDAAGNTLGVILGPVLTGMGAFAGVPDTDRGLLDGDTTWDRAVGPTQFLPATWRRYGADGNGDGKQDPNNIYDATLATARYLCAGGADLASPQDQRAAVFRYNNSGDYVDCVLLWAAAYRRGVTPAPDARTPIAPLPATSKPPATAPPRPSPSAPPTTTSAPPPSSTAPTAPPSSAPPPTTEPPPSSTTAPPSPTTPPSSTQPHT